MLSKEEIEKPVTVSSAQGLLRFSIAYHRVPAFVPLLAIHWCCFFQLGEDSRLLVFRSLFLFSLLFLEIIIYSWNLSWFSCYFCSYSWRAMDESCSETFVLTHRIAEYPELEGVPWASLTPTPGSTQQHTNPLCQAYSFYKISALVSIGLTSTGASEGRNVTGLPWCCISQDPHNAGSEQAINTCRILLASLAVLLLMARAVQVGVSAGALRYCFCFKILTSFAVCQL